MATEEEISDAADEALLNALQNPKREQSGTRIIEEHPIGDILKARDIATADEAALLPHFGLRRVKMISPGCG